MRGGGALLHHHCALHRRALLHAWRSRGDRRLVRVLVQSHSDKFDSGGLHMLLLLLLLLEASSACRRVVTQAPERTYLWGDIVRTTHRRPVRTPSVAST